MLINGNNPERVSHGGLSEAAYEEALENFYGMSIWRELHALLEHQEFNSSPKWIANKLNISIEEALDAVEGLTALGLIGKNDDGSFFPKQLQILIPTEKMNRVEMAKNHLLISHQILNGFSADSEDNFFRNCYYLSNKDLVDELTENIKLALKEFREKSDITTNKDGLYAIQITGTNIIEKSEVKNDTN